MPTRDSSDGAVIKDAKHLLTTHKKHAAAFRKMDLGRKKKLIPEDFLSEFAKVIKDADKIKGQVAAGRTQVGTSTADEAKVRAALVADFTAVRDEIKIAHDGDKALHRVFGVGAKLSPRSTPSVLAAAGAMIAAFEDQGSPEHREKAEEAGVSQARITRMEKLRDLLAGADSAQQAAQKSRKGVTTRKSGAIDLLTKGSTRIRAAAGVVFRGNKEILAEFGSTRTKVPANRKRPRKKPEPK